MESDYDNMDGGKNPNKKMNVDSDGEEEEEEEKYRTQFSGVDYFRLSGVTVLTLVLLIAALILDNLSIYEQSLRFSIGTGKYEKLMFEMAISGSCGFTKGKYRFDYKRNEKYGRSDRRSAWGQEVAALEADDRTKKGEANGDDGVIVSYSNECQNHPNPVQQESDCNAATSGVFWIILILIAVFFNIYQLFFLIPLYICVKPLCRCECVTRRATNICVASVFFLTSMFSLAGAIQWLASTPCNFANPYNASLDSGNDFGEWLGYSTGCAIIAGAASFVAFLCSCFCWGDNRSYGQTWKEKPTPWKHGGKPWENDKNKGARLDDDDDIDVDANSIDGTNTNNDNTHNTVNPMMNNNGNSNGNVNGKHPHQTQFSDSNDFGMFDNGNQSKFN